MDPGNVWQICMSGTSKSFIFIHSEYLGLGPGVRAATLALKEKFGIDHSGGHAPLFTEDWDA